LTISNRISNKYPKNITKKSFNKKNSFNGVKRYLTHITLHNKLEEKMNPLFNCEERINWNETSYPPHIDTYPLSGCTIYKKGSLYITCLQALPRFLYPMFLHYIFINIDTNICRDTFALEPPSFQNKKLIWIQGIVYYLFLTQFFFPTTWMHILSCH